MEPQYIGLMSFTTGRSVALGEPVYVCMCVCGCVGVWVCGCTCAYVCVCVCRKELFAHVKVMDYLEGVHCFMANRYN